jgi:hypothetical protein
MGHFRHTSGGLSSLMSRRLLLPLVVVATGLLAACVPVTPAAPPPPPPPPPPQPVSQYCAASTPSSAAGYKAAFDNLRKTYTEWASADGAVPVHLPDGRTLWLFGDTFIGKVSSSGAINATDLVSNSAVLQTGRCFKPLMGGAPLARSAWIADTPTHRYWPASAIVNAPGNRLSVFLMRVRKSDELVVGMSVATFSLPSLSLLSVSPQLAPTSTTRPYGGTAVSDDQFAYLYSSNDGNFRLARAPVESVADPSTWQYWTGATWSLPGASVQAGILEFQGPVEEVSTLDLLAPIALLQVTRHGAGFLGTAMLIDGFSNTVIAYTAPAPEGPWTRTAGDLATTPANLKSYSAQTHFDLQGTPSPVLGYSTNVDFTASTITQYGPRFVTPANLPAPLEETAVAETPEPTSPPTNPTTNPTTLPPSTLPPTSTTTTTTSSSTSTTTEPTAP